ncbi:MAG: NAD(P)/FAD-dependent oxidoreductase [Acidobacteriota bacterium]
MAVIGAGMTGSMIAIYLARQGFEVSVYELRDDLRKGGVKPSRSLNMTLSPRGLGLLKETESVDAVMPYCVKVRGRIVHHLNEEPTFHPYGRNEDQILHAIRRNDLNGALLTRAESFPQIKLFFRKKLIKMDLDQRVCFLKDMDSGTEFSVKADFIVGADGSFSTVRKTIHKGCRADYQQEYLDWDYKELTIPAAADGSYALKPHALHVWPRRDCMIMSLPNPDGSFNCICSMPATGDPSFAQLKSAEQVQTMFAERFPDALALMPTLIDDFLNHPTSTFVTTRTSPWYDSDRVVLVGDACHTVVPFYGQGMIAGFEDCSILNRCIEGSRDDLEAAFRSYQAIRKPNTEALADLSISNFVELRDKILDPRTTLRKRRDDLLGRLFPGRWIPLYTLIAHSRTPYAEAIERCKKQERIARWLGLDLVLVVCAGLTSLYRALKRRRTSSRPTSTGRLASPQTKHLF